MERGHAPPPAREVEGAVRGVGCNQRLDFGQLGHDRRGALKARFEAVPRSQWWMIRGGGLGPDVFVDQILHGRGHVFSSRPGGPSFGVGMTSVGEKRDTEWATLAHLARRATAAESAWLVGGRRIGWRVGQDREVGAWAGSQLFRRDFQGVEGAAGV